MKYKIAGLFLGGIAIYLLIVGNTGPTPSQKEFFDHFSTYCGKAYEGKLVEDNSTGPNKYKTERLVMHVRNCGENELRIPFHVGNDRSRTWVITKTTTGILLKHDHRHEDGTSDDLTLYGGHTADEGWGNAQSFPADDYSKNLFVKHAIPQSTGNTWHMYIYPGKFFGYRLTREGREFRVDFDLSKEVDIPPAPWGSEEAK